MDHLDGKLLDMLQVDGRMSYASLGKEIGLSVTAVKERIDKLQRSGVLKNFSIEVDAALVGYSVLAFVFIAIDRPEYCEEFENQILEVPEVQECHHVTGGFNYLVKVMANDMTHLEQLLLSRIKIPHIVSRSETTIVFSSSKNSSFVKCARNGSRDD
ncbi:Lrp/AsnC family transcriptional regulator [Sneathiella limimaris]|uniref:Lrp/AsnC family transcriptional regulator n=1 Tax=Sneathiella limimaris TaxID=1964213 RepID=UPI00146B02AE|nr:Lrp/AsnC family transcriptional regulator [Sneathiella limimaris]